MLNNLNVKRKKIFTYTNFLVGSFLLLPVWYITGLDQFIWPFIVYLLFLVFIIERSRAGIPIVISQLGWLSIFFLLAQIISGFFIIEREYYIVFARNILAWSGGVLLLIILTNVIRTREQILKLTWSWTHLIMLAGLIGIIAYFLNQGFEIKTLALYVVPSGMRDGITAETVWTRSFLAEPFGFFGKAWYRVRSFFLYANSFAAVLVMIIPMSAYFLRTNKIFRSKWWYVFFVIIISLTSMLTTTSRAGIIGLVGGFGLFIIARTNQRDKPIWGILVAFLIVLLLTFILVFPDGTEQIVEPFYELFVTSKGQSFTTRVNIINYSIISWLERPLFGWGTPRDIAIYGFSTLYPRLGSHNQFLSVLYRNGIFGFLIYIGLLISLMRRFKSYAKGDWRRNFQPYLIWSVSGNLLHSIFLQLDVDLILIFVVWMIWAIVDILPNLNDRSQPLDSLSKNSDSLILSAKLAEL